MRKVVLSSLVVLVFLGIYIRQDFAQTVTPTPLVSLQPTNTLTCSVNYSSMAGEGAQFCQQVPFVNPTVILVPSLTATPSPTMVVSTEIGTPIASISATIAPPIFTPVPTASASPTLEPTPRDSMPSPAASATPSGLIYSGSRDTNKIALTFDADMTPWMKNDYERGRVTSWYNSHIIDILNQTNTRATLFLSGMWIEMYPNVTKTLGENALFELANHSYSHPGFDGTCYGLAPLKDSQDVEEVIKTQNLIHNITGNDSRFFRFPGGCYSQKDLDIVQGLGVRAIQWDVAGDDGFTYNTRRIIQNVVNRVQGGSIIVLHLHGGPNAPMTAYALPEIIAQLTARGYEFVKLSELLDQ